MLYEAVPARPGWHRVLWGNAYRYSYLFVEVTQNKLVHKGKCMRLEPAGTHAKITFAWESNAASAKVTVLSVRAAFNARSNLHAMHKPLQYFYGLFRVPFGYGQGPSRPFLVGDINGCRAAYSEGKLGLRGLCHSENESAGLNCRSSACCSKSPI
jgi:hypothetical protein